jgi:PP-loop superfamily ATP-utilizing enzyme
MTTKEEIEKLEQRKDMAAYQRKITTCLGTAIEYGQEIAAIDRRLENLRYRLRDEVATLSQNGG